MMTGHSGVEAAIREIEQQLMSARHWADASFVHLPLVYPSGSPVTVKVDLVSNDFFRISDNGFAYREIESVGAQRSFPRTADSVAADDGLSRDARCVFVGVPREQLSRGISDVATASWRIVDRIFSRIREENEDEIVEYLTERLFDIFGESVVDTEPTLIGASTSPWELTAVVVSEGKRTAFQAVGGHANSIYRTNAAFDDLAALDDPPGLVAVVQNKRTLGPRLTLLARSGRVIESGQPDADYRRAAA
jgi:hypothetical protein